MFKERQPKTSSEGKSHTGVVRNIVKSPPRGEPYAVVYAEGVKGSITVALGRWNEDDWLLMSYGTDDLGQELLRQGYVDANVGYFPETYGAYLIPAAVAHMHGNPVPAGIYIDHMIITMDNINDFYPE